MARGSARPALPIGLLALDIDGTLVGEDLVVGPRTRAAITAATGRGVAVSLVTGRMVSSARRFADDLGLRGPVVGYQGGLIREMPPVGSHRVGRLLFHRPLPAAVAREVVEWSRAAGLDPHLNHLERFVLRADDPKADDYSAFMGHRAELVPDLVAWIRHPVTKVLAVGDEPRPGQLLAVARERFAGRADVTISHPRFLEFVAPGVSKGRAVRWLSRRHGVPLGRAMAIGDQWNDFEMLQAVGHGVAMPSAPAAVRAVARYVAPPVGDEGAAALIEALVLADPPRAAENADRLAHEAAAERERAARELAAGTELPGEPATATGATEAASIGRPRDRRRGERVAS
jgi:Cof subfamily protein (haloacid dehalogenase superfamily)